MTGDTRPDSPAVLSAVAIRSYMRVTGWTEGTHGSYGSVFERDGFKVSVPLEDRDPDATRAALYRLAVAERRDAGVTEAAVRSYRDARGSEVAPDVPTVTSPAPDPGDRSGTATGPAGGVREALGRLVRETWVKWALEQPDPRPSWLASWDELDGGQREVDMRIGRAVADYALTENAITWNTDCTSCARVLDSAVAERERAERAEAKLAGIETRTPAIVDALRHALAYIEHVPGPSAQAAAERYRSALAIISAGQEADRG